jgi:hypothetical protein
MRLLKIQLSTIRPLGATSDATAVVLTMGKHHYLTVRASNHVGGQLGVSIKMGKCNQNDGEKSPDAYADPNGDVPRG